MVPGTTPPRGWPHRETAAANTLLCAEAAACTGCGKCGPACPEALSPQTLYESLLSLDFGAAVAAGLGRCNECGLCDPVCPSRIPLRAYFAQAHLVEPALVQAGRAAAQAASRHTARTERLARTRAREPAHTLPDLHSITGAPAAREVAAAVARAQGGAAPRNAPGER
jgi:electron transport complex protein RnfC